MNTILAFFKSLKIKFEVAKDIPYDAEFVEGYFLPRELNYYFPGV